MQTFLFEQDDSDKTSLVATCQPSYLCHIPEPKHESAVHQMSEIHDQQTQDMEQNVTGACGNRQAIERLRIIDG